MAHSLAGLLLTRAQFGELAGHCTHDPEFPSWIEWNKRQIKMACSAQACGEELAPWGIDVGEFQQWCKRVAVTPCIDGLRAYCHALRGGHVLCEVDGHKAGLASS